MKILYIITQADGGGAQNYVLTLAKHFGGAIAAGSEATQLFEAAYNLQLTTYNLKQSSKYFFTPSTATLSCFIESLSRTVTLRSLRLSTSTVMQ